MELLQELFVTAFVAIIFSFFVAKLISVGTASDGGGSNLGLRSTKTVENEPVVEKVKFDRGLKVGLKKSIKRVRFVVDEVGGKLDEVGREESVDKLEESRCGEEIVEKSCDLGEICDGGGEIEVEESGLGVSDGVGLSVTSSEVAAAADVAEIVGGFDSDEVKGGNMETGLERLVVEERREGTELEGENTVSTDLDGLDVEEKIGNGEVDDEIGLKLGSYNIGGEQSGEVAEDQGSGVEGGLNKEEGLVSDEDGDWEGIERSELEKVFGKAANYVGHGGKEDRFLNLGSDVEMQLYGLQKVAMEGPCHEAQPMALMVSARAKWNAWQRLGNMSPEVAMEQYISLLSEKDPGWVQGDSVGDVKSDLLESEKPGVPDPNISTYLDAQLDLKKEKELEMKADTEDPTGRSNSVNMDKE